MSELSAYVSKACAGCCPASSAHCRKRTRPGIMRRLRPSIRRGRHGIKQPGPGIKRRARIGPRIHFFFEGLF